MEVNPQIRESFLHLIVKPYVVEMMKVIFNSSNSLNIFQFIYVNYETRAKDIIKFLDLNEATVYRILNNFEEKGVIENHSYGVCSPKGGKKPKYWRIKI